MVNNSMIFCIRSMDVKDGVYIERLLIEKANDLNNRFETDFWTPRKIDMVLWTYRESEQENKDTQ